MTCARCSHPAVVRLIGHYINKREHSEYRCDRHAPESYGAALRLLDPSGRRFWLSKVEHV